MTTTEEAVPVPGREEYIQLNVPGLAYSVVFVPLWAEDFGPYFDQIAKFSEAYGARFTAPPVEAFHAPSGPPPAVDGPPVNAPPQGGSRAPQRPQTAQKAGSGLWCPEHNAVELIESNAQYQQYDENPDGGPPLPAKFFCPGKGNGTGKNHSVWRSQALVRQAAR